MTKKTKALTAADVVGKTAKFIVPVRDHSSKGFRVDVKIMDLRNGFGRQDLQVQPVAGDGEAWVSKDSVEDIR